MNLNSISYLYPYFSLGEVREMEEPIKGHDPKYRTLLFQGKCPSFSSKSKIENRQLARNRIKETQDKVIEINVGVMFGS